MRYWIYNALVNVVIDGSYSNLYLRKHLQEVKEKDRALATRIFYGTIQNYRYCMQAWKPFVSRKVNDKLAILLTMSCYQLLFLDKVPRYAIINDAVNIAKRIQPKAAGMVNAVLRKVNGVILPDDENKALAIQYSLPDWLVNMWVSQYGMEQCVSMASSSTSILPMFVRRNSFKISHLDFIKDPSFEPYHDLYIYHGQDYFHHPYYLNGYMSAQDEGSYLISQFMDCQRGDRILDCCAAPGTKSFAMAERMHNKGSITSLDLHMHRVELIESDKVRLGLDCVHPVCMDATDLSSLSVFDRVLCDVPCSGYGVLSRKPDIKLRMSDRDMDSLIPLQYRILCEASKHVKTGGYLVYSTCTMNKKENEKQIEKFLKNHASFELVAEKNIFPTSMQDGFYMAKLVCR